MKITEHEMLVTVATMALKMNDLTGHDIIEALRGLGHGGVVTEAREADASRERAGVQAEFLEPRAPLAWFCQRMEEKLRANDHKGHWSNCTMTYLRARINEELEELELAIAGDHPHGYSSEEACHIVSEAADVSNFAMMIADNVRGKIG